MKTLTINVDRTVNETKEIKLPFYCRTLAHAYKIFSKDHCLKITDLSDTDKGISIEHAGLAFCNSPHESWREIPEAEFMELFENTMHILKGIAI